MTNQVRSLFHSNILETDNDSYQILCTIEFNQYVSVHHALSQNTHQKVVIKFISSSYPFYESSLKGCEILRTFSHPNVVQIHDSFRLTDESSKELFVIIMDHYPDIDLFYYLRDYGPLCENQARLVMKQLASALLHISTQGIVHRQIIPENILIQRENYSDQDLSQLQVALTGFTAASQITKAPSIQTCNSFEDDPYAAPELLTSQQSTILTDVYSLGIIFYQLFTCETPRGYVHSLHLNRDPFEGEMWSTVSPEMKDLIKGMIDPNPNTRFTPEEIINHKALIHVNPNKFKHERLLSSFLDNIPSFEETSQYF